MLYFLRPILYQLLWLLVLFMAISAQAGETDIEVMITEDVPHIEINHRGIPVKISRIQDPENRLIDDFSKTSRPCPPFCLHPMKAASGVQTLGEIELLDFIKNQVESGQGLLIDARMPEWYESETIPGSVNIPFVIFTQRSTKRDRVLELLGAKRDSSGNYDFTEARNLCLFCNGPWCDQSPRAIKSLITAGYPASKLAYYRGGMQLWKLFGLTTVLPKTNTVESSQ